MPDGDRRGLLRVAVRIEEQALLAEILDHLDGRPGLRVVEAMDEADVVLHDMPGLPDRGDVRREALDLPQVTLVPDRTPPHLPAGSVVLPDASGPLLEAVLRATAEGYVVRPERIAPYGRDEEAENDAIGSDDPDRMPRPVLTPRERDVLALLAEGAPNKVIARRLGISPSTAKFHVASLLEKLGARSRLDAVAIGARLGLVLL